MNILCIGPVPPPYHGASIMFKMLEEAIVNHGKKTKIINNSLSINPRQIGKINIIKVVKIGIIAFKIFLLTKRRNIYQIYWVPSENKLKFLLEFFLISVFNNNKKVYVYSHSWKLIHSPFFIKKLMSNHSFTLLKLANFELNLLPNSYILPNFTKAKPSKKTENKNIKIVYFGNFLKSKGVLQFIEIAKYLSKNKNLNLSFAIAGQEADISSAELITLINNTNIAISGPKFGRDKLKFLSESDVLIFPTVYENEYCPLVILEALACQTVVFSTKAGVIPEIIGREFVLEPNRMAIEIEKKLIEEGISSLRKKSKFDLKQHTQEEFNNKLLKLLNEI